MRISAFQFAKGLRSGKMQKLIGKRVMYRYANKDKPVIGVVSSISMTWNSETGYTPLKLSVKLDDTTSFTRHIKSFEIIL